MKHILKALSFAITIVIAGASASASAQEATTLTIIHFNDIDRFDGKGDAGGPARLATIVKQMRTERENVLVTHGGDTISPSLLAGFDQGAHMIELFNKIGIDAMALGNHEFDFGPEVAVERIAEADFPMLSNNAIDPDGSLVDGVTDRLMLEFGGYKVGLFGLTTTATAVKSSPAPVTFKDAVATAEEMSAKLREEGAQLVIALAHTDLGEDNALRLAKPVDVVLSGDDHDVRVQYDGDMLLTESGSQAEFVTVITLEMAVVEGRRGPFFQWSPSVEVINTATIEPDPELQEMVDAYEAKLSAELDIEIGTTEVQLDTRRPTVRGSEAAFANLIADAMLGASGGDVALTNGGGIRADRIYEPGTVLTRRDILSELPFGNSTILIEVTGAQIVAALENGVSQVEEGAGRYPHVANMSFAYEGSKPAGARVSEVKVAGEPIDLAKTYKLATNDYVGRGGDGYGMFADAPRLVDANAGELMATQVIRYIESEGQIAPTVEGRITRLD